MRLDRPKEGLVFASIVGRGETAERQAVLLAESIRSFGGVLAPASLWWFVPTYVSREGTPGDPGMSPDIRERLTALGVELIPFEIDAQVARFFFASDLTAAALAEARAVGVAEQVAWLCANTLVFQEPRAFRLHPGKQFGFRPVHHTNIGSRYGEAPDAFWSAVYRCCEVPDERLFPMVTQMDNLV